MRTICQSTWPRLTLLLALLCLHLGASADELDASVDRTRLTGGETLQLTLTYDAQVVFGEPDFSSLDTDFEVLATNRQSQLSIVNGSNQSSTAWRLTLSPKRAGKLVIPSFNFKGAVSDAIEVEVGEAAAGTGNVDADKTLYVETLVDRESAYVQEQILLTLRLYSAEATENLTIEPPDISNASIKEAAKSQYQKVINGRLYLVSEIRFAVFAEVSGELRIPPAHFSGVVIDRSDPFGNPFFSRGGRRIAMSSEEKPVHIKPRAPDSTAPAWLPSTAVGFSERWSASAPTLTVGEPVTRTITVTAVGLTAAQLPPLPELTDGGLQIYPDQPQLDEKTSDQGITGRRTESTAIVPTAPGTLTIPDIRLEWWDTSADQRREAVLPGRTFTVVAAPGAQVQAPSPTAGASTAANPPTPTIAAPSGAAAATESRVLALAIGNVVLLVAALVFAVLWWRNRHPLQAVGNVRTSVGTGATDTNDSALFQDIREAAKARNLAALRNATLAWATQHWSRAHIASLSDIAMQAASNTLAAELRALFAGLDGHLYAGAAAPDPEAILQALQTLRAQATLRQDPADHLPPLYPIPHEEEHKS